MAICVQAALRRSRSACGAVLLAALLTGVLSISAADFPVGTPAQIVSAMASAKPGDTVTMTNKVWLNADILFKGNGAPGNPITLRAQTPGHVILSGSSRLRIAGRHLVVDGLRFQNGSYTGSDVIQFRETSSVMATNCALINCAIVDYNPANTALDNKWISIYGISNRVENCYIKGKLNSGATLVVWPLANVPNYHVIRGNYFGPRPDYGENGAETIRVGTSDVSMSNSRTLVESNFFFQCNGEVEIISSKTGENVYRHNTFDSCEGALTLRHGNRNEVYGNFFLGRGLPRTGGVRIIGEDHKVYNNYFADLRGTGSRSTLTLSMGVTNSPLNGYFQVRNAIVAFNTAVNCTATLLIGNPVNVGDTVGDQPPRDCVIANNVFRTTLAPLINQRFEPINLLYEGNFMHGASLGIPQDSGISTANPHLVLADDGLWRPAETSPVIGAAVGEYPFVTHDIDGQARVGAKDAGCDQLSAEPVSRRPLTAADTGPEWMRSAGTIRTLAMAGEELTMSWDALPQLTYQIQFSSNLLAWTTVETNIVSAGAVAYWTDDGSHTSGAPTGSRYYRVVLQP